MTGEPVLSRHRLPRLYRWGLAALWFAPVVLIVASVLAGQGLSPGLVDPHFWLPLAVMAIPAVYLWREGVDVLPGGLVTRVHWPRYYPYAYLKTWMVDDHPARRVLTIWDVDDRKVFEQRTRHLTDLSRLLGALDDNIHCRSRC